MTCCQVRREERGSPKKDREIKAQRSLAKSDGMKEAARKKDRENVAKRRAAESDDMKEAAQKRTERIKPNDVLPSQMR